MEGWFAFSDVEPHGEKRAAVAQTSSLHSGQEEVWRVLPACTSLLIRKQDVPIDTPTRLPHCSPCHQASLSCKEVWKKQVFCFPAFPEIVHQKYRYLQTTNFISGNFCTNRRPQSWPQRMASAQGCSLQCYLSENQKQPGCSTCPLHPGPRASPSVSGPSTSTTASGKWEEIRCAL